MSTSTTLTHNEALPVNIGTHTIYCDSIKVLMTKNFAENCSVTGSPLIEGIGYKGLKITFIGKIYSDESPYDFLAYLSDRARYNTSSNITYNGIVFNSCYIIHFDFEDSGENFSTVKITFISNDSITGVTP